MSTTTKNDKSQLETLAEQAEQAREALAIAQARVEAENQAAEQRRAKAHEQFDRQTLAEFDEGALEAAIDEARGALTEAVLADPVWQAMVRLNIALRTRALTRSAYLSAASRLKVEVSSSAAAYWPVTTEDVLRTVVREAEDRAADLADAHDQARFDAGEKAANSRK